MMVFFECFSCLGFLRLEWLDFWLLKPFVVCSRHLVLKNDSRHFYCFCQSRLSIQKNVAPSYLWLFPVLEHAHQFVSVDMAVMSFCCAIWPSFVLHSSGMCVCEGYTLHKCIQYYLKPMHHPLSNFV